MTDAHDSRRPVAQQVGQLIELGLDREAAVLGAAAADHPQTTARAGGPMDPLEQLDQLGPLLAGVVGNISPGELDAPTPSGSFTVHGVLTHMIGGATAFAAAFRGQSEAPSAPDGDVLAGFGAALGDLAAAMHERGALDRTVTAPFGDVPGSTFARFVVLDGLVHGWDLATATGQPYDPPDALVADVTAFAADALDPLRDGDTFAAAVQPPAGATAIERLVALTGRQIPG
jgi:uncharacterized protein (TIGR03086 family)